VVAGALGAPCTIGGGSEDLVTYSCDSLRGVEVRDLSAQHTSAEANSANARRASPC